MKNSKQKAYCKKVGDEMYEERLKPCPFCGGIAHVAVYYPDTEREFHVVECEDCGVQSAPSSIPNLIKHWNTRTYEK